MQKGLKFDTIEGTTAGRTRLSFKSAARYRYRRDAANDKGEREG